MKGGSAMSNSTHTPTLETFRNIMTLKDGARVLFRPLTAQDYEGLANLFLPLAAEDRQVMRQSVDETVIHGWLDHLDYDKVLPIVAEIHHEIVGEATLHYGTGPYRHTADLRLFLAKAWRQRGIGTRLIQTMIDLARRQGLQILTAEVIASQVGVVKAFEGCGFRVKATLEDHFMLPDSQTLDVVLMTNSLVSHSGEFLQIAKILSLAWREPDQAPATIPDL
jgi:acetyltransferase